MNIGDLILHHNGLMTGTIVGKVTSVFGYVLHYEIFWHQDGCRGTAGIQITSDWHKNAVDFIANSCKLPA